MSLKRTVRNLLDSHKSALDRVGGNKLSVNLFSPLYWSNVRLNARLRDRLPELVVGRIADVGCGAMPYSVLYDTPRLDLAIGLDLPLNAPQASRKRTKLVYAAADATHLPLAGDSMDLVLLTSVAEHVGDTTSLMSEILRCLRPGGTLCMSGPFAYGVHGAPYDYWRQTPLGLALLLSRAGFTEVEVETCGGTGAAISVSATRWLYAKARGTNAARWKRALLRSLVWPLIFPVVFGMNLWGHAVEALLPDSSLSPMMFALARKPLTT